MGRFFPLPLFSLSASRFLPIPLPCTTVTAPHSPTILPTHPHMIQREKLSLENQRREREALGSDYESSTSEETDNSGDSDLGTDDSGESLQGDSSDDEDEEEEQQRAAARIAEELLQGRVVGVPGTSSRGRSKAGPTGSSTSVPSASIPQSSAALRAQLRDELAKQIKDLKVTKAAGEIDDPLLKA